MISISEQGNNINPSFSLLSLAHFYRNKIGSRCIFGCRPRAAHRRIGFSWAGSHSGPLTCSKVVTWNLGCSAESRCKSFLGMPNCIDHQICLAKYFDLFTTDWTVRRNSDFSSSGSPWCRKFHHRRATGTSQQAAGVGISHCSVIPDLTIYR